MNIKTWMKWGILIFFIISMAFLILSFFICNNVIEIIAVTLITTFYHACVRPLTGSIIDKIYHNKMDFNLWWFRERKFERLLYKVLRVKCWKKLMPTYDKSAFDMGNKSIAEILGATCQAEIVHEIMLVLAFLPLLLIIPYGKSWIFIISSVICALIESVFIIMQRFNRPRLKRIYEKQIICKRNL